MRATPTAASFTLAVLCALSSGSHAADEIAYRPYGGALPGAEAPGERAVQVFDAHTGLPIAGANVLRYEENADTEAVDPPRQVSTVTDEFGIATLREGDDWYDAHWVFDAPGFAPTEEYGTWPDQAVWIERGQDVELRLLNALGEPLSGVHVELGLGCGHAPAVRTARTDSTGRFVLRDIHPDTGWLWFEHDGALSGYESIENAKHGELIAAPGVRVEGVVVTPDGDPVHYTLVRSTENSRGPRVVTTPEGVFRLRGLAPGNGIAARPWSDDHGWLKVRWGDVPSYHARERTPLRIVTSLDPEDDADLGETALGQLVVRPVSMIDEATGRSVYDTTVALVHEATGWAVYPWVEEPAEGEEPTPVGEFPLGRCRVESLDGFGEWEPVAPTFVETTAGDTSRVEFRMRRRPLLRVDLGNTPEDATLWVALFDETAYVDVDDPPFLPANERAMLHVETESVAVRVEIPPAADGVRAVRVPWPDQKTVFVPLPDGEEIEFITCEQMDFEVETVDGGLLLTTYGSGSALVRLEAEESHAEIHLEIPERAETDDEHVRASVPAFQPDPESDLRLRVLAPDGSPIADADVSVRMDGVESSGSTGADGWYRGERMSVDLRAGGGRTYQMSDVRTPALVTVDGWGTQVAYAETPGDPIEVRFGDTELSLAVVGAPEDVHIVACIDGLLTTTTEDTVGPLVIRGLTPGRHTVVVDTPDHSPLVFEVELRDGDSLALAVPLPPEVEPLAPVEDE